MKKIKHELVDWNEGRAFMNRLADEYGLKVEEIEENLKLTHDDFTVSCHLDPREFSYILVKMEDESHEKRIQSILDQFKAN